MKAAELVTDALLPKIIERATKELQARLDKKAANMAVVKTVTSPEGNIHVRAKPNLRGGALTRVAVGNVIDDYLRERFPTGNTLGVSYVVSLTRVKNTYHIYFSRSA